jgi:hypothetical protein
MFDDSEIRQGPKKGLRALVRKVFDDAMERDPIENIKETYDGILDDKNDRSKNEELFAVSEMDEDMQEDPVQHIRETYDQRMEPPVSAKDSTQSIDPFQRFRDSYQQALNSKFSDPAGMEGDKQKIGSQHWWKRFF